MNPIGAQAFTLGASAPAGTRTARGFTLIELMITVAIAAILLMIAVPSFQHAISNTNLDRAQNDLLATLHYARTEAVTRGTSVAVAASSSGDWADGWKVLDSTNAVLREHAALEDRYTVGLSVAKTKLTFSPQGSIDQKVCFTMTDTRPGSNTDDRHILMLPSGSTYSQPSC